MAVSFADERCTRTAQTVAHFVVVVVVGGSLVFNLEPTSSPRWCIPIY